MSTIIAEIGTSHEGSKEKAFELIDAAAEAGADAIKFQWVYADEILHPNTGFVKLPTGNIPLYERFRQLECSKDFYRELLDYVHSKGCKFCCSPFGLRSLQDLLEIKPDILKVASPELNHYKMLEAIRDFREKQADGEKIPLVLSSGVSKLADIEKALDIVGREGVSLLHCVTSYPAPEEEYNLRLISNLKNIFGIECGVSDHSLDPILVPSLSIACGGSLVEKHITLSRQTAGLDDPVALEPEQFAMMVHVIHQTETLMAHYGKNLGWEKTIEQLSEGFGKDKIMSTLGDGIKRLAPAEEANYGRTNRSLHFMKDFKSGHKISPQDISILRTEKVLSPGISPDFYDSLIGALLVKDVKAGQGIQLSDFIKIQ
ncbi:MAG: N-acetylneuraminate synthase family protein [Treponema sp.]|nr:N-acetylneuraminate synthase family protein [Treponema sp.]